MGHHSVGVDGTWLAKSALYEFGIRLLVIGVGLYFVCCHPPFERRTWPLEWEHHILPFSEKDSYPIVNTIVVSNLLSIIFLIMMLIILKVYGGWSRNLVLFDLYLFLQGSSIAVSLTFVVCEIIKRLYGRLRPDYMARCLGPGNLQEWMQQHNWTRIDDIPEILDCSASPFDEMIILDGRMSFPSEHASLTAALFMYDALWLFNRIALFKHSGGFRIIIPFGVLIYPLSVAISRTSDYRHHATDVIAGLIIGTIIATVSFQIYFTAKWNPISEQWAKEHPTPQQLTRRPVTPPGVAVAVAVAGGGDLSSPLPATIKSKITQKPATQERTRSKSRSSSKRSPTPIPPTASAANCGTTASVCTLIRSSSPPPPSFSSSYQEMPSSAAALHHRGSATKHQVRRPARYG